MLLHVPLLLCCLYKPPGAYIRRGDLTEGFLRYEFVGLIFGGAYFRNFTVSKKEETSLPNSTVVFLWR